MLIRNSLRYVGGDVPPVLQKLLPGTGFGGTTPTPDPVGSPADIGYADKITAAWSVPQFIDITGKYVLMAIADHIPENAKIAENQFHNVVGMNFQAEGGPVTLVTGLVTVIGAISGRPELGYAIEIDAADFVEQWPVSGAREFRCWPELSCGQSIVMQGEDVSGVYHSLWLNMDGNGTLFRDTRYVDIINGVDTNNGLTAGAPKKTVHSAKEAIFANPASGGQVGGGEVIMLYDGGGYKAGDFTPQNFQRYTNKRWFTIRGAPGVTPIFDTQSIEANGSGWRIEGVRFVDCAFTGTQNLRNNNANATHRAKLLLENPTFIGEGQTVIPTAPGTGALIGSTWQNVYVVGGNYSDAQNGLRSVTLAQAVHISRIGEDFVSGSRSVQNCVLDNLDRGVNDGTGGKPQWHPDLYAFNSDAPKENITLWNIKATNIKGQGISADVSVVSDIISASFTKVDIDLTAPIWNIISFGRPTKMVHFRECNLTGGNPGNLNGTGFTSESFYIDGSYSDGVTTVRSGQPVTVRGGDFPIA